MADVGEEQPQPLQQEQEETAATVEEEEEGENKKTTAAPPPQGFSSPSISLNIWPPTQRTREAVIHRLVETLSSPSVLSKRYGSIPRDEASATARQIEQEAFSAASAASDDGAAGATDDDGIETLQIYSKEISKRMLESVKARASASSSSPSTTFSLETPPPSSSVPTATSEEISSLESESLQA